MIIRTKEGSIINADRIRTFAMKKTTEGDFGIFAESGEAVWTPTAGILHPSIVVARYSQRQDAETAMELIASGLIAKEPVIKL